MSVGDGGAAVSAMVGLVHKPETGIFSAVVSEDSQGALFITLAVKFVALALSEVSQILYLFWTFSSPCNTMQTSLLFFELQTSVPPNHSFR